MDFKKELIKEYDKRLHMLNQFIDYIYEQGYVNKQDIQFVIEEEIEDIKRKKKITIKKNG